MHDKDRPVIPIEPGELGRYEVVCDDCRIAYHGPLGDCPVCSEAAR